MGFEHVYDYVAGKADWGAPGPSARLRDVAERMRRQGLTNLPVTTSDGRLVGLLLREDAERALQ